MKADSSFIPQISRGYYGNKPITEELAIFERASTYLDARVDSIIKDIYGDSSFEFVDADSPVFSSEKAIIVLYRGTAGYLSTYREKLLRKGRFFLDAGDLPYSVVDNDASSGHFIVLIRNRFYLSLLSVIREAGTSFAEYFSKVTAWDGASVAKVELTVYPVFNLKSFWSWSSGAEETIEDDPWVYLDADQEKNPERLSAVLKRASDSHIGKPASIRLKVIPDQILTPIHKTQSSGFSDRDWRSQLIRNNHQIVYQSFRGKLQFPDHQDHLGLSASTEKTFSVVIPFFRHLHFLERCLESIAISAQFDGENAKNIEVILVNDDPSIVLDESLFITLEKHGMRARLVQTGENNGITKTLNAGIELARNEWIVFLDCDDQLVPETFLKLRESIELYPRAGYISSNILDLQEIDQAIWNRPRTQSQQDLLNGMFAGHIKVVKKEVFEKIGKLNPDFNGCQDFEFALRYALFDQILFSQDYLYIYSWHENTQSISMNNRQRLTADLIRSNLLYFFQYLKENKLKFFGESFQTKYRLLN